MGAAEQSPKKRSKNNSRGEKQVLLRQLKKLQSFRLKERMRSDLITLCSTNLKWFGIEWWVTSSSCSEGNKQEEILFKSNQQDSTVGNGKRISSSSHYAFNRRPRISIPGILQKDTIELCLNLPAKNLETSFTVVSL